MPVLDFLAESFADLMQRGGWVMWPLLALSVIALTLVLERVWFYLRMNRPGRLARVDELAHHLRRGEREAARKLAAKEAGIYGEVVAELIADDAPVSEAVIAGAIESRRHRLERFMPTLSTIITAAPMLGILGTVLGIIASFEVLAEQAQVTDPARVSQGIAEALITTAVGLLIAVVTLFPYNALRAQLDRTLSRLESLAAAATGRDRAQASA